MSHFYCLRRSRISIVTLLSVLLFLSSTLFDSIYASFDSLSEERLELQSSYRDFNFGGANEERSKDIFQHQVRCRTLSLLLLVSRIYLGFIARGCITLLSFCAVLGNEAMSELSNPL